MVSVKCCDKGAYQIAFTKPDFMPVPRCSRAKRAKPYKRLPKLPK